MKTSYEFRAKKFIEQIAPIIPQIFNARTVRQLHKDIDQFNTEHHRKVIMSRGITRIALITSDYVIKIDYEHDEVFGDCEAELHMYEIAEADGFDYMFAKITRYQYNNMNFYIMPRIEGINPYRDCYATDFMTDNEIEWCNEHNLIDLHSGNFGWKNKHVVIIDYAARDVTTGSSSF